MSYIEKKMDERILGQELMIPGASNMDGSRAHIAAKQLNQIVQIVNPEPPKINSGYETLITMASYAETRITGRILLENDTFIVYSEGKKIFSLLKEKVSNTVENYGVVFDYPPLKTKEFVVDKPVKTCNQLNSDRRFQNGVNAKTIYYSHGNSTYEDGILISESLSKKLSYYKIDTVVFSVNKNDLFLERTREDGSTFTLPGIGEKIQKGIVGIRRKIDYGNLSLLKGATELNLRPDDTIIHSEGTVLDINVYCNDEETLKERGNLKALLDPFMKKKKDAAEFIRYIKHIEEVESSEGKYEISSITSSHRELARSMVEGKWLSENKTTFDFLIVEYIILKECPIEKGSKLTNRFAGKGVRSLVLPDSQMPVTEDGEIIHLVYNPISPENRLIAIARYELELNFIIEEALKKMNAKNLSTEDYFIGLMEIAEDIMNEEDFAFMLDAFEKDRSLIPIAVEEAKRLEYSFTIRPLNNKLSLKFIESLYDKYDVKSKSIFINGVKVNQKVITGSTYVVVLRHQPKGKMSSRNSDYYSRLGKASKPSTENSQLLAGVRSTPVRIGEGERLYLQLIPDNESIRGFVDSDGRTTFERALSEGFVEEVTFSSSNKDGEISGLMNAIGLEFKESDVVECPLLDELLG